MPSPMPMSRSALIAALKQRRDNDVFVRVPCETGGYIRLPVREVIYNSDDDSIDIVTDVYLDGPDDEVESAPHPQHVTLIDDGSGDPPAVVHGDRPLSPEAETAMRAVVAAVKRGFAADIEADPSIGERQEAAINRVRENARLRAGVEAQQAQGGETS
jgi:hypothetical protein